MSCVAFLLLSRCIEVEKWWSLIFVKASDTKDKSSYFGN
uniref:Uncharacterized protein n=1 Tax=Physcomitrium patens TaxID=3218 RepID=A0A2K1IR00_PHYPA|nr:hypothetical protein PHYPA_025825 [Physcomitrium patens]